jgi:ketosteroid isomerase-like protein
VMPDRYIEQGDTVVVLGVHRGAGHNGTSFEIPFVHVWKLRNGKAVAFDESFDTAKLNAALGLPSQRSATSPVPAGTS